MSELRHERWRMPFALAFGLSQALLLTACSSRDEILSEKVAAAEAAAQRAIEAQHAAERAAKSAGARLEAAPAASEPEPEEFGEDSLSEDGSDGAQYETQNEPQMAAEAVPAHAPPTA